MLAVARWRPHREPKRSAVASSSARASRNLLTRGSAYSCYPTAKMCPVISATVGAATRRVESEERGAHVVGHGVHLTDFAKCPRRPDRTLRCGRASHL